MSEVEMKVWIRGRAASLTAFQAASMSATWGRRRAIPPEGGGEEVAGRGGAPSPRSVPAARFGTRALIDTGAWQICLGTVKRRGEGRAGGDHPRRGAASPP